MQYNLILQSRFMQPYSMHCLRHDVMLYTVYCILVYHCVSVVRLSVYSTDMLYICVCEIGVGIAWLGGVYTYMYHSSLPAVCAGVYILYTT